MSKIYVAGHSGLVGSAIVREIEARGTDRWVGARRSELDLSHPERVREFVRQESPDVVIVAAARVGGIGANSAFPVEFLSENLKIEMNLIEAAAESGVPRLLFLGSSCIYPRLAHQPIREEYLLTGELEPSNEPYALSKIAGIKLVQAYRSQYGHRWISAMPTNLYGPHDNFNLLSSHVLPAMIRRFHEAKMSGVDSVTVWGSGEPRREFLHVDDLARACLFLVENYDAPEPINVGWGTDVSIRELAVTVADAVGFTGRIDWDVTKPDGTPRKLLDTSRINALGWVPEIPLEQGIRSTYDWFQAAVRSGQSVRM